MGVLAIVRRVLHLLVLIFTIVVLGISANIVALASKYGANLTFADFALAVSIITLLVLVPCYVLDRLRANAVLSWTAIELAWNGVLWVLWLAVAAYTTSIYSGLVCSARSDDVLILEYELRITNAAALSTCQQVQALMGIPWVIWLLLLALFIYLLAVGIMQHNSGNSNIWTLSAADAVANPSGNPKTPSGPAGAAYPMAQANNGQPGYAPTPASGAPGSVYSGVPSQAGAYGASPAPGSAYAGTAGHGGYAQPVAQV